jgi:hypothetical protein
MKRKEPKLKGQSFQQLSRMVFDFSRTGDEKDYHYGERIGL